MYIIFLKLSRRTYMDIFENVNVIKKANVYFGGKVTSRTVMFGNGEKKTLGIMLAGEYEFGTAEKEIMEILAGSLDVLLPGEDTWKTICEGESFEVPENSRFKLVVKELADYCCSYVK
jgi:purine/pyrimidine-nucleoside phosphorylase